MSRRMEIDQQDQGGLLDLLARDHTEFGFLTEAFRDSALAGADKIVFGLYGLDPSTPSVIRRYVADNGSGMTKDVFEGAYSKFGKTATTLAYDVTFDVVMNEIHVVTVPYDQQTADKLHTRHGIGGRLTGLRGNPVGIATVTIADGEPLMTYQFRLAKVEDYASRTYAGNKIAVRPYKEQDDMDYAEAYADADFMESTILREDDQDYLDAFLTMAPGQTIDNPLAGFDWTDIVPDWIADHKPDTGPWTINGQPAHGTVKLLLGKNLNTSSGFWADESFPNEHLFPARYGGYLSRSMLDLSGVDVQVQTLQKIVASQGNPGRVVYQMPDVSGTYRLVTSSNPGQYPLRKGRTLGADGKGWEEVYDKIWDLGDNLKAWVSVAKTPNTKGFVESGYDNTTGLGMIGVHYGNETHQIPATPANYREMGVPVMSTGYRGVTVIFDAPLARFGYEAEGGIFQTTVRDGLKWAGADSLPWSTWFKLIAAHPEIDVVKRLLRSDIKDGEKPELDARIVKKVSDVLGSVTPGKIDPDPKTRPANPTTPTEELAVLEDPDDQTVPAIDVGPQGRPPHGGGTRPMPVNAGAGGGKGGTKGKRRRGIRTDADPDFLGRQSHRAKVGVDQDQHAPDFIPPTVVFWGPVQWAGNRTGAELSEHRKLVASWEKPSDFTTSGGVVYVNRNHLYLASMDEAIAKHGAKRSKRDPADVEVIFQEFYSDKIKLAYAAEMMFANQPAFIGGPIMRSKDDAIQAMLKDDFWWNVLSVNYVRDVEALAGEVQSRAAAA